MKKLNLIFALLLVNFGLFAQETGSYDKLSTLPIKEEIRENGDVYLQADFSEVFGVSKNHTTHDGHDHGISTQKMVEFLNQPQPNVETIRKYIFSASKEFNVPFEILDAIAKTYNNYSMLGPSQSGAYGIMGLIDSKYSNTLAEAAKLINVNSEIVKTNPKQHIRAGAALLSYYAGSSKTSKNLLDWFEAVKEFSGLNYDDLKEMQAINYYKVINEGLSSITLWKEMATIKPLKNPQIFNMIHEYDGKIINNSEFSKGSRVGTIEYPGAINSFTSCNFNPSRSGKKIDTWVNHWIGLGTVESSINTFRNCDSEASAHFIVALDGKIHQILQISEKSFGAGAPNTINNERSISVEHDAVPTKPDNWNNEVMLKASTDLARFFINKFDIPRTRPAVEVVAPGIRGHKEMPGVPAFTGTVCPGNLPWTKWMNLLNQNPPPPSSITPVITAPTAGQALPSGRAVNFAWRTSVVGTPSCRIQVSKVNAGWTAANGFTTNETPSGNVVVNRSANNLLNYAWTAGSAGSSQGPLAGTTYWVTVRAFSGASGPSQYSPARKFSINSATARESIIANQDELKIFPNPSNGEISLNFNSNSNSAEMNIFDLSGVEVFSKKYQTQKGDNVLIEKIQDLKSGNYIVIINNGDKILTQNIIINNK